jgi:hypothetical protein
MLGFQTKPVAAFFMPDLSVPESISSSKAFTLE